MEMKRRKGKTLNQEAPLTKVFKHQKLRSKAEEEEESHEEDKGKEGGGGGGFFACYLLTSLSPRHKGHTYIGFTVNPRRRIRQHNGEIGSGAWRTKRRRPWEMVLCIYGFPTNVSALQFEWAWQHPLESIAVRQAAAAPAFKSLSGVANKIKLAYTMLTLPPWHSFNITLNYFSTKYTNHSAACPTLPKHIKVEICPLDNLPCYTHREDCLLQQYQHDDLDECNQASNASETVEEPSCLRGGINNDPSSPITTTEETHKTPLQPLAEIDVIDLLTPSPDRTKKTRVSPEIIDLTFT